MIRFGKGKREREKRESEAGRQQLLSAMKMLGLEPSSPTAREVLGWTDSDDVDAVKQMVARAEQRLEEARRRGVSAREELELMVDLNSWRRQLGTTPPAAKSSRPIPPAPLHATRTDESQDENPIGATNDSREPDYVDAQRFAFAYERVARGWSGEVARVVAWALLPFPSSPIPSHDLEEAIRVRCSQLAKELNRSQNSESESLNRAGRAAKDYVKIAKRFGDSHLVEEWSKLLTESIECEGRFA